MSSGLPLTAARTAKQFLTYVNGAPFQPAIAVGEVHPDFEKAAAAARQSYLNGVKTLRHGATFGDVVEAIGPEVMTQDGHCTYLADRDWILNDAYPGARHEPPYPFAYLYHVPSGRMVVLGEFVSPAPYEGELRIDLHPRGSPDGRTVIVD